MTTNTTEGRPGCAEESESPISGGFTGSPGTLPAGWEIVAPNPALAPRFALVRNDDGSLSLHAQGNGRRECFGYVRHPVSLQPGKTYRLAVRLRSAGLDDLNRHLVHGVFGGFNNGILAYRRVGDAVLGEARFAAPSDATEAVELRLYFRFSADGQVWWDQVSLTACDPVPPRPVTIACAWGRGDMEHWARWLDEAGRRGADIALLPEMFNDKPVQEAEPLDGPSGQLLADKARAWRMHVSASFYERRGALVLNTAPLYGPEGQLLGAYSKNQLYDPEEDQGATPGVGYPVFQTDVARIGIIICYDSWFPEPTRLLAYKGAEIVLLPNAGYYAGLMPARAADNGVWMAVSSLNCPAGIWEPGGGRAGELEPEGTRYAPSSLCAYQEDQQLRLLLATVDLSAPYSPHWWGGPMRSAPGGRRVRQTLMEAIEDEIAREARRWWVE